MQNILLQGRAPNVLGNIAGGNQVAQQQGELARTSAYNRLLQEQGAQIASGDQNALSRLAAFDPAQSQQIAAREQQRRQSAAASARAAAAAQRAAQVERERQQALNMLGQAAIGLRTGDNRAWEMVTREVGAPGLEATPENFDLLNGLLMRDAETIMSSFEQAPPDPSRYKVVGNVMYDLLADGGPQIVGRGVGNQPGFSVTTPDGTTVQYGQQRPSVPPGQNPSATGTPRDPDKLSTALSAADVDYLSAERDRARAAEDLRGYAATLGATAGNIGYTGPGGKAYGTLDQAIGILPGDEAQRGAFRSASMDARLTFTEKTKGAITDREMGDFATAVPNEAYGPETNKFMAQALTAGADRVEKRFNFFEDWAAKFGSLQGAEAVWDRYMNENPLISGQGVNLEFARQSPTDYRAYLNALPTMAYTPDAIRGMSLDQLNMAPIETFTADQLDAITERYSQIGGGQ